MDDLPKLRDSWVLAPIDQDQASTIEALGYPKTAEEAWNHVALQHPQHCNRLGIVFLERNMETVLEAALACAPHLAQHRSDKAKPPPTERDIILSRIAFGRPEQRECVLRKVPSFEALRNRAACALRGVGRHV